jgi:hypothetical protein
MAVLIAALSHHIRVTDTQYRDAVNQAQAFSYPLMDNATQPAVAERLTQALALRRRSQNWLAGEIRVAQSTLNRQIKENTLALETVVLAADALGVDVRWLLSGQGAPDGGGKEMPAPSGDLYAMLADVRAREPDGLRRVLEIEAISAAIRAEAALVVARAVEKEGAIAETRQQEVRRVSGGGVVTSPAPESGDVISDQDVASHGGEIPPPAEQDRASGEG